MIDEVIHLSDLVMDLKQRVEALERELASRGKPFEIVVTDLHAKWDQGKYDEGDFVA